MATVMTVISSTASTQPIICRIQRVDLLMLMCSQMISFGSGAYIITI